LTACASIWVGSGGSSTTTADGNCINVPKRKRGTYNSKSTGSTTAAISTTTTAAASDDKPINRARSWVIL
jgi:hypothetical protein